MNAVLCEQSCVPAYPHATTLAQAVLWNYAVKFEVDCESTLDLIVNDDAASERSKSVPVGLPSPEIAESQTVRLTELHVLHAQSVHATIDGVAFLQPLRPFVQQNARIGIGGTRTSLASHLTTLLHDLIGESPFPSHELSIECRFSHPVAGGTALVPVLLVAQQGIATPSLATLAAQCSDAIHQWRSMARPVEEGASFIFSVTFWPAGVPGATALLQLTNLTLPCSDLESQLVVDSVPARRIP